MTHTTDDARREWDAPAYDTLNAPMNERGNDAVARLEPRGDETVLDAGCGTGQVTATLLGRLPRGRVVALDGSRQMLDAARERFAGDARVSFVRADLGEPLAGRLGREPVDAVVSTSTFHWVRDHDALFRHLADVLRPGGQLVVDCGGAGNIEAVLEILRSLGHAEHPWTYAGAEETEARLRAAGFDRMDVRLVPRVSRFDSTEDLERYFTAVALRTFATELGPVEGPALVREVAARLPARELHWVRLEIVARLSDAAAPS
jgi:trans-aconitate 2-methyltransferase